VDAIDMWVWWLVIALVLGIAEVVTTTLVLGMLAAGAGAAALAASAGANIVLQAVAFVVVSAALLVTVRPVARRHLRMPPETRTGSAALVGQTAVVTQRVDAQGGRVKIGGEIWSARALHPDQVLETGATVDVIEIEGATALVYGPESLP
jgi:membrane protein implicated in regulation of membrane protease activity